jgi:N-methylhydantoinase A
VVIVAIDIGGTFTDLIGFDDASRTFAQAKSLTTPDDLSRGILDCIRISGLAAGAIDDLIHGSTIAINTLIERRGASTGLIVTEGTRDVYLIGRGNRPESYNLFFHRPEPLVSRKLTREVRERVRAGGAVLRPLDMESLEASARALADAGVKAVAICFLHSYVNPDHERRAAEVVRAAIPDAYVSLSHEILREYREYERMSTTVVNAYIGPTVGGYVRALEGNLRANGFRGDLAIMRSNGGVMSPDTAARQPVAMMESGPVGGIIAAARVGAALGMSNVISFDMGGTTAKASLIRDGRPNMAPGYYVGGYASGHPVMIPLIDIVEVGAGGGSIAWIDDVDALKVGPQSSGADPGPMCYGRGGTEPTITDANVVLGRLNPRDFLGGAMELDAQAAARGVAAIGEPLGLDPIATAQAILQIAVMKMSLAVREVSVAKGYDPRDFALVASGGAGPLHVLAIARELHIPTVVIPLFPAHFSALGMLLADERHDLVRTYYADLQTADLTDVAAVYDDMLREGRTQMRAGQRFEQQYQVDVRYAGQDFTMSIPIEREHLTADGVQPIRERFDREYEQRYAYHSPGEPVEIINLRVALIGKRPQFAFPAISRNGAVPPHAFREVYFDGAESVRTPVFQRADLHAGTRFAGPAIVQELGTTTVLFAGDACTVTESGELIISVGGAT